MDHLWSPWRYQYVTAAAPKGGCVFCEKAAMDDEAGLIVYRGEHNFVVLNLYPYTSGHIMVAPYEHTDSLAAAQPETAAEMMHLIRRAETAIRDVYRPAGINIGMNLGSAAGAGVAGHIHMHLLPRWVGDVNFMTTVAETRVMVEDLTVSWRKLRDAFAA